MTLSKRRTATLCFVVLSVALILLGSCSTKDVREVSDGAVPEKTAEPPWFEDVSDAVGLNFVHDPGPTDSYFTPQMMGSGCAFLHEMDGTLYIYLLHMGGPDSKSVNRLYKRLPDGKLQDVSAGSGLDVAGYNTGVAIGDVNNDGLPDVLLTQYGGIRLFLNLGNGRFSDVTAESGLSNPQWGVSAAFLDYNRDGLLDLFVVNYLDHDPKVKCNDPKGIRDFCGPVNFPGTCSKLFRNLGAQPAKDGKPAARARFEDVSFASGIGRITGPGLGVACADFDDDGWPDIFVANDGSPNRLWINQRNGTFIDEAVSRNVAYTAMGKAYAGMGVAIGDTSNSGMFDLYVTHLGSETNTLWKQGPRGQFRDRTVETGLTATRWRGTGFGTLLADFNLDGFLDMAIVNGRVFRGGPATNTNLGFWETYAEKNQVFANDGTGKFRDISLANPALCGEWNLARGLACEDFDDDGPPDLLLSTIGNRARLLHNVAPNRGHWLKVRAVDPRYKRDAYGAEVFVRAASANGFVSSILLKVISPAARRWAYLGSAVRPTMTRSWFTGPMATKSYSRAERPTGPWPSAKGRAASHDARKSADSEPRSSGNPHSLASADSGPRTDQRP